MVKRLVVLPILPMHAEAFVLAYNEAKPFILSQTGCLHLELLRSRDDQFITLSHWDSEDHLNAYRSTPFFEKTWKHVKTMFSGKAQAFTTVVIDTQSN